MEGGAYRDDIFGIDETGAGFRFLNGGHDGVNHFGIYKYGSIEWWRWIGGFDRKFWFVGEKKETAIAGARFGFIQIGGI